MAFCIISLQPVEYDTLTDGVTVFTSEWLNGTLWLEKGHLICYICVYIALTAICFFVCPAGQLYSIVSSMSKEHVLSAGFDINTPDNFGRTCLHAAASGG